MLNAMMAGGAGAVATAAASRTGGAADAVHDLLAAHLRSRVQQGRAPYTYLSFRSVGADGADSAAKFARLRRQGGGFRTGASAAFLMAYHDFETAAEGGDGGEGLSLAFAWLVQTGRDEAGAPVYTRMSQFAGLVPALLELARSMTLLFAVPQDDAYCGFHGDGAGAAVQACQRKFAVQVAGPHP